MTENNYSIADIAAVTRNNNDGGGWGLGGGGGLVALIAVFLVLCLTGRFGFGGWGFGGGGMGGGMGGAPMAINMAGGGFGGCATTADIQRNFDTQTIINSIRGTQNGLCDGFYAQNTNLLNGFSAAQNTMAQGFAGLNTAMVQQGYETRNASAQIGNQLQACCCDINNNISGVNYNMATHANALQNQISNCCCETTRTMERGFCDAAYAAATNTTAIVQNAHNDADRILAKLNDMEATRQQERINALERENQSLRFDASQCKQNAYLVNAINPQPVPAYTVPAPWQTRTCQCPCG